MWFCTSLRVMRYSSRQEQFVNLHPFGERQKSKSGITTRRCKFVGEKAYSAIGGKGMKLMDSWDETGRGWHYWGFTT